MRGYNAHSSDMCIETILRSINKLQAGMSALMSNDSKMIELTKIIYYTNSIIYTDKAIRKKLRKTNEFYEFMQGDIAE